MYLSSVCYYLQGIVWGLKRIKFWIFTFLYQTTGKEGIHYTNEFIATYLNMCVKQMLFSVVKQTVFMTMLHIFAQKCYTIVSTVLKYL